MLVYNKEIITNVNIENDIISLSEIDNCMLL